MPRVFAKPHRARKSQTAPYSDLLINGIEKIAPTLRRLQKTNDPEAEVLAEAVLDGINDPHLRWEETALRTGMHKIAVEILCEDQTYIPQLYMRCDYPARMFTLLRSLGVYLWIRLEENKQDTQILEWVDEVLGLLPRLWEYMLKSDITNHHIPCCIDQSCKESTGLPNALIYTAEAMHHLYVLRHDRVPPVTDPFTHLALWMWTNSGDCHYDDFLLQALILIMFHAKDAEIKSFFQEAVLDKDLSLPLAERFRAELLYEYNLDAPLSHIITFFGTISFHCIRIACQRQICLSTNDNVTNNILATSLNIIRDIIRDYMEPENRQQVSVISDVVDPTIIPMTARVTFYAINENAAYIFSHVLFILEVYGTLGRTERQMTLGEHVRKVLKASRDLWYPTVQAIRAHPILASDQSRKSLRDSALQAWLAFGKQVGFDERVEEQRIKALEERGDTTGAGPLPSVLGTRSCRWKECLCSWDEKPPHQLRVCKGCWRVWYCGVNCQTKDWRYGGHKEYCQSHRL